VREREEDMKNPRTEMFETFAVNGMQMRDAFAVKIMAGICAGDWKFDTSEKTWDQVAVKRAYEIADVMIKERDISNV
jgi:hypothetical protein